MDRAPGKDPGNNTAREERSSMVNLPLTSKNFDLMCHFLRGSVTYAVKEDKTLDEILVSVFKEGGLTSGSQFSEKGENKLRAVK